MGNKYCFEAKSKLKQRKNSFSTIVNNIDDIDKTMTTTSSSHKIKVSIKKTRKSSLKKNYLSNISINKKNNNISRITSTRSNKFTNSFNIINSQRRVFSPTTPVPNSKKMNFNYDYSPLKKYKKSNTMKIYIFKRRINWRRKIRKSLSRIMHFKWRNCNFKSI